MGQGASRDIRQQPRKFSEGLVVELLDFAREVFHLSSNVGEASAADHLKQAEQALGRPIEKLHPKPPKHLHYLWVWFQELDSQRTVGMSLNPIAFSEILSWAILVGVMPTNFEVRTLIRLDNERLKASHG